MNEKIYYLDLPTVVRFLRGKSAQLTTKLLVGRFSAIGSVLLVNGAISTCSVEWAGGRLEGTQAYECLKSQAEWKVVFEQVPAPVHMSPVLPPTPLPSPSDRPETRKRGMASLIPFPTLPHHKAFPLLDHFPPHQRVLLRTVYTLIDGRRTVELIKMQLPLSAEVVDQALSVLQQLDLITYSL